MAAGGPPRFAGPLPFREPMPPCSHPLLPACVDYPVAWSVCGQPRRTHIFNRAAEHFRFREPMPPCSHPLLPASVRYPVAWPVSGQRGRAFCSRKPGNVGPVVRKWTASAVQRSVREICLQIEPTKLPTVMKWRLSIIEFALACRASVARNLEAGDTASGQTMKQLTPEN